MEIIHLLAFLSCESDVPPDLPDCTSGFHATYDVPFREILVFETHLGFSKDPDGGEPAQHSLW